MTDDEGDEEEEAWARLEEEEMAGKQEEEVDEQGLRIVFEL